jgi:hypothetical protein
MQRSLVFSFTLSLLVATQITCVGAPAQSNGKKSQCDKLLSPEDIAKATGLTVGKGQPGPKIAGANGSCVWRGSDGTQILVVLSGRQQMATTMDAMAQSGGSQYDGLGAGAVGTQGIPETGGGYNLSFLDARGGVAVTIPGSAGTSDRTMALGKLIEKSRSGEAGKDPATGSSEHGQTASGHGQTASDHGQTAPAGP